MNIEQLEAGLDRYGGDLAHWPATERAEAAALAARDPHAVRLIEAAARVEAALAETMRPMAVDAALIGRIVAGIGDGAGHDLAVRPTRRLYAWAGAAMVAFLITGYAVGLALPASQGEDAFAGLMFGSDGVATDASTTSDSGSVL